MGLRLCCEKELLRCFGGPGIETVEMYPLLQIVICVGFMPHDFLTASHPKHIAAPIPAASPCSASVCSEVCEKPNYGRMHAV